jgi:hypothetical protein
MNNSNPSPLIPLAIAGFVAWQMGAFGSTGSAPAPNSPLAAHFTASGQPAEQVKADAKWFGEFCGAVASYIEYDGQRHPAKMQMAVDVDRLRVESFWAFAHGDGRQLRGLDKRHPQLIEEVSKRLQAVTTQPKDKLDDGLRRRFVEAWRGLGEAAGQVAGG